MPQARKGVVWTGRCHLLSALVQPTGARGRSLGESGAPKGAEAAARRAAGITPELSPPRTVVERGEEAGAAHG